MKIQFELTDEQYCTLTNTMGNIVRMLRKEAKACEHSYIASGLINERADKIERISKLMQEGAKP